MRIRNTSRDRANCSCLFALSLCAAAVEHQDELFALLSYETAGIAAFLRLHTEDAGENHPGFGFGKTLEHNYELMAHLEEFSIFELPLLVGVSRKSMIYKLLGGTPQDSLNGTTVLDIIRIPF